MQLILEYIPCFIHNLALLNIEYDSTHEKERRQNPPHATIAPETAPHSTLGTPLARCGTAPFCSWWWRCPCWNVRFIVRINCEIYQRGRVSKVAYTEQILLIAHLIRPPAPGSIPGVVGVVKSWDLSAWECLGLLIQISYYLSHTSIPITGLIPGVGWVRRNQIKSKW